MKRGLMTIHSTQDGEGKPLLEGASVLVTGGTGSFGKAMTRRLLKESAVRRVVVYSRDELKQHEMSLRDEFRDERIRFFIGDVRDKDRLARAFDSVDYVIHAAAMKQVPTAEYNPFEAVKTNVIGAQNVIECAIDKGVKRVVALSTDKAANPINLYGATKLCSDKLFVSGNVYAGFRPTRFAVVRYGNVVGSRGSVIPLFLREWRRGVLPITDERMTRFWITLDQGVDFVLSCLASMGGGEVFVPKIPSMRLIDLAKAIGPECRLHQVGIRNGEKLHEVMITDDDSRHTVELPGFYVIDPGFWFERKKDWRPLGSPCADGFRYASDTNTAWLTRDDLMEMILHLDLPEVAEYSRERGHSV